MRVNLSYFALFLSLFLCLLAFKAPVYQTARAQMVTESSEYVDLLKRQADERKQLYQSQAQVKNELKQKQTQKKQDLLRRHREARAKFTDEKHSADERRNFYSLERSEMVSLREDQKIERKQLKIELSDKLREFNNKQNHERADLRQQLIHKLTADFGK